MFTSQDILDFHANKIAHPCGLYIKDFVDTDDEFWNTRHDFIQWLFPNREPSKRHPDQPYLPDIYDYQSLSCGYADKNIWRFFEYLKNNSAFCCGANTHNDLRVTRVIKFCSLVNCMTREEFCRLPPSVALFWNVMKIVDGRKSWDTAKYWHEACEGWRLLS